MREEGGVPSGRRNKAWTERQTLRQVQMWSKRRQLPVPSPSDAPMQSRSAMQSRWISTPSFWCAFS